MSISKLNGLNIISFYGRTPKKDKNEKTKGHSHTKPRNDDLMKELDAKAVSSGIIKTKLRKDEKTGLVVQYTDLNNEKNDYYFSSDKKLKYKVRDEKYPQVLKRLLAYRNDGKTLDFDCILTPYSQSFTFYNKKGKREALALIQGNLTYRDNSGTFITLGKSKSEIDSVSFESINGKYKYSRFEMQARSSDFKEGYIEYKIREKKNEYKLTFLPKTKLYKVKDERQGRHCVYDANKKEFIENEGMTCEEAMSAINRLSYIDECLFRKQDEVEKQLSRVENAKDDIRKMNALDTRVLSE